MQLNDSNTNTLSGIVQDIDFRCSTSNTSSATVSVSYPTADKVRNINQAYDRAIEFLTRNSKKIQYADTVLSPPYNITSYNVVSGTALVTITEPWKFERAEIKDANGNWTPLELIDVNDIDEAVQTLQGQSGLPKYIRIDANRATLIPTPNASVTGGLTIFGSPEPTLFAYNDTTKTPLLPRFAHGLLSIGASIAYCNLYKKDRVEALLIEESRLYEQLGNYLVDRDRSDGRMTSQDTNAE